MTLRSLPIGTISRREQIFCASFRGWLITAVVPAVHSIRNVAPFLRDRMPSTHNCSCNGPRRGWRRGQKRKGGTAKKANNAASEEAHVHAHTARPSGCSLKFLSSLPASFAALRCSLVARRASHPRPTLVVILSLPSVHPLWRAMTRLRHAKRERDPPSALFAATGASSRGSASAGSVRDVTCGGLAIGFSRGMMPTCYFYSPGWTSSHGIRLLSARSRGRIPPATSAFRWRQNAKVSACCQVACIILKPTHYGELLFLFPLHL